MKRLIIFLLSALTSFCVFADDAGEARDLYQWMQGLEGDWMLAPTDMQQGRATGHKLVAPLPGTDAVAMQFRQIGKGSTVQEVLLPGTGKEMVTMYHCGDSACSQVKATHYCVKQNQPEMLVDLSSSADTLIYNCDMSTGLCQSGQDHVHKITHALTNDGQYLKTTCTSFANGEFSRDSVYVFTRK